MTYISSEEKCKRITKYILMALITICCLRYIPSRLLSNEELIIIAFTSSISFAILDMISPSITINHKVITQKSNEAKPYDNEMNSIVDSPTVSIDLN